jgi:endonuclease-3
MNKSGIVVSLLKILKDNYPNARCSLIYKNNFEFVVATMLSARCTDLCVNKITPTLFGRFADPYAMACADTDEIERIIYPCGFFKVKSKNIKAISQKLVSDFDGNVPRSFENIVSLPGIGRKSANLIMAECFGVPGIIVDTHVFRVSKRFGLHLKKTADKAEVTLKNKIPKNEWTNFSHRVLEHGRKICKAGKPKCDACVFSTTCIKYGICLYSMRIE